MSTVTVEESFELAAAPDLVWSYLTDPEKIVVCLPGAELLSVEDDGSYQGRVRVKVGAVTVNYAGTMAFTSIDEGSHRVEMEGKGREKGGAGTASMTMVGRVESLQSAGCRIHIKADVQLTGKIVRFGRGMIGAVSREVFSQFAECLGGLVTDAGVSGSGASAETTGPGASGPVVATVDGPAEPAAAGAAPPISAFGLLLRTMRSSLRRLLRRLFSRS